MKGISDRDHSLSEPADLIKILNPPVSYISIPTGPLSEEWVQSPDEATVIKAYFLFSRKELKVELLTGFEGDSFFYSGDIETDILGITAVHPMREDVLMRLTERSVKDRNLI
ncbi:MAG: hypothetical protein QW597_01490 [Thermoplasmataceae archaeon]